MARLARTLTHHWVRGLFGALAVLVVLVIAAGAGGEAADDFSTPGDGKARRRSTSSARTPRRSRASDSTLVFTVQDGKITAAGPREAVQAALAKREATSRAWPKVADPFARGGTLSKDGRLAAVDVRYTTDPADIDKADGEKLIQAGESAERNGVEFSARGADVDIGLRAGRRWASDRRLRRDHPAHDPLPLVGRRWGRR